MRPLAAALLCLTAACGGETTATRTGASGASGEGGVVSNTGGAGNLAGSGNAGGFGNAGGKGGGGGVGGAAPGCNADQCVIRTCQGKIYGCGDCVDNDGDGLVDSDDPGCLGPCHNSEEVFAGMVPASSPPACTADCYFDQDYGSGNDQCCWDHRCDPLAIPPDYPPEGPNTTCEYKGADQTATYKPSCSQSTCDALYDGGQTGICTSFCRPLTPNGCDCFGCCKVPQASTAIWLGSIDNNWNASCTTATFADPKLCKPCTIVPSCFNPCDECELCLGKPALPPECSGAQQCPAGIQACGLPGQACCPPGTWCTTGCCQPTPN